jgi:nitrogen regulatory protein P-II 1
MKQIIATLRPHLADDVLDSLRRAPVEAVCVHEVKGYGRQKSYLDEYQVNEYADAFVPKVEIVIWVDDRRCEEVLEKITSIARTGRIGDGKILVLPTIDFIDGSSAPPTG